MRRAARITLDGTIRLLQVASVIPIAGAVIGVWNAVESFRAPLGWSVRARAVIVALALIGFLWIAYLSRLIGWSLNY